MYPHWHTAYLLHLFMSKELAASHRGWNTCNACWGSPCNLELGEGDSLKTACQNWLTTCQTIIRAQWHSDPQGKEQYTTNMNMSTCVHMCTWLQCLTVPSDCKDSQTFMFVIIVIIRLSAIFARAQSRRHLLTSVKLVVWRLCHAACPSAAGIRELVSNWFRYTWTNCVKKDKERHPVPLTWEICVGQRDIYACQVSMAGNELCHKCCASAWVATDSSNFINHKYIVYSIY